MSREGRAGHSTRRWAGIELATLLGLILGVAGESAGLLLASAVGVAYTAYSRTDLPGEALLRSGAEPLAVERRLGDPMPGAGEKTTVTVKVENTGNAFLFDVRLSDEVPAGVTVVEGSPDYATALGPGAVDTYSYTVGVRSGTHAWERIHAIVGTSSGALERSITLQAHTTVRAMAPLVSRRTLPVDALSSLFVGRIETDSGGAGIEFHSTRQYQPGDPMRRVDWKRFAQTNELGTVNFRQERRATIVLIIDARKEAFLAPGSKRRNAVERATSAAQGLLSAFISDGNKVGVAVLGRDEGWLPPGMSRDHRTRAKQFITTEVPTTPPEHGQFESFRSDRRSELETQHLRDLAARLPDGCAVILLSPCWDRRPYEIAEYLAIRGYDLTVLSPDPTVADTPGRMIAESVRRYHLRDLRRRGIRVIDWRQDERLAVSLTRAGARWS